MHRPAAITISFACFALVAAQSLGLHLHIESDAHNAGSQAAHLQHHLSDQHDHDTEIDASKLELGNVWLKSLPPIQVFGPECLLVIAAVKSRLPFPDISVMHPWRQHWRPPLRAPPIPA